MAMSGSGHAGLEGGTSEPGARCQSRKVTVDGGSERLGQISRPDDPFHLRHGRWRSYPQSDPGAIFVLDPSPGPERRIGPVLAHRVIDHASHDLTAHGRGCHDAE